MAESPPGPLVTVNELLANIDDPDRIVVDCRFDLMNPDAGRASWGAGHIPGAYYADLDRDLAAPVAAGGVGGRHPLPERDAINRLFRSWGMHADSQLVVYDDTGNAVAARLWWLARWLGHSNVAALDGGFPAWEAAGYPVSTDAPAPGEGSFDGVPGALPVIDAERVAAGLATDELVLLDARIADRFDGKVEPLDTRAGHVPGAVNAPLPDNLGADKCFRAPEELRAYYRAATGGSTAVAAMCGSGVTACHTLLALELAGMPGAALYAGSWSDWISDAGRPVTALNDDEE